FQRINGRLLSLSPPGGTEVTTRIHRRIISPGLWHPPRPVRIRNHRRTNNAFETASEDHHELRLQLPNERQPLKIRLNRLSFARKIPDPQTRHVGLNLGLE